MRDNLAALANEVMKREAARLGFVVNPGESSLTCIAGCLYLSLST